MTSSVLVLDQTGVQQYLGIDVSSVTDYIPPGSSGTWTWFAEQYGYGRLSGTFDPSVGGIAAITLNYARDASIAQLTKAAVAAYTSFSNYDQLYDYSAYMRTQVPSIVVASATGGIVTFTCNLVFSASALSLWSYNSVTNTLTVKSAATLAAGSLNTLLVTSGTISTTGTQLTGLYNDGSGNSARLNYSGLTNSTVYLSDDTSLMQDEVFGKSGNYVEYIPPTATGTWAWVVERYGYQRQSASLQWTGGGDFSAVINYLADTKISQASLATVAAYTDLTTVDMIYDYAAYMRTLSPQYVLCTASGGDALFTCNLVLDKNASSVWSYNASTNTLTIKSTTLSKGIAFGTLATTLGISFLNGTVVHALYSSSAGRSSNLNFTGLAATSILVLDNTGAQFDLQENVTGNYSDYLVPSSTGTWNWIIERYGYSRQTAGFSPTGGDINATLTWTIDQSISQTVQATVAAYTTISTLDQLYDYGAYMRTQSPEYVVMSKVGTNVLFGATTLILDPNAASIWSFNTAQSELTVRCNVLAIGNKFTGLSLSGTMSFLNGASTTIVYSSSSGPSASLEFTGLSNSQIYIARNDNTQYDYETGLTGTYTTQYVPGLLGTWSWIATQYGYIPVSGTFTPGTGGVFTAACTWFGDTNISVSNVATVSAYTSLNTANKVYDYANYYATQQVGIAGGVCVNISGTTLNFGSYDIVIDALASSVFSIVGNTVTIKASTLTANVTTSGTVSYLNNSKVNGIVSDTTGYTSQLIITGLNGCSLAVITDTEAMYDFQENQNGTYTLNIPSDQLGNWTGIVTKYGIKPFSFTFTLGTGLASTVAYNGSPDSGVTQPNVNVTKAYLDLNTTNMMYDYFSYWSTTQIGIPWYSVSSWSGTTLDVGNADIAFDPTFPVDVAAFMNPTTLMVDIRCTNLSGDLRTNGTVTRSNGATTSGLVTDSTGTTAIVTISPVAVGDKIYIEDSLGGSVHYSTATGTSFTLYLLPGQEVAGEWKWAVKRVGYSHSWGTFTCTGGGRINLAPNFSQIKQPDGNLMYTGSSAIGLSVNWTESGNGTPRILVGNNSYAVQFVYDTYERALTTQDGMKWLANGGSTITIATLAAGSFVFLGDYWQFMEATNTDYGATIEGFATSTSGRIIDGKNGPVSLLSASGLPDDLVAAIQNSYTIIQAIQASYALETSVQKAIKAPANALLALGS